LDLAGPALGGLISWEWDMRWMVLLVVIAILIFALLVKEKKKL
jgi:hypothetical protein